MTGLPAVVWSMDAWFTRCTTSAANLVCRPVLFFAHRLRQPSSWILSSGALAACVLLTATSQWLFLSRVTPALVAAATEAGVPAAFVVSMQYLGILTAAGVCLLVWLVASAVMVAADVLFVGSANIARIVDLNALAFYSQVPWLLVVVVLAWLYHPPLEIGGLSGHDVARLSRLLQQDSTTVVIRTVSECAAVWLHTLFGASYHALSGVSLPRALSVALAIYGLPHLARLAF